MNPKPRSARRGRRAFTLIEMMVVIAIIGVLIGGVFMLMSGAGTNTRRAQTIARMERLQNALSGFYAEYGTYPPVEQHNSPDPWAENLRNDFGSDVSGANLSSAAANQAARAQPLAYEFPNVESLDEYINIRFREIGVMSINQVLGPAAATIPKETWQEVKIFKFGVMSFLLPRIETVGLSQKGSGSNDEPNFNFFISRQWKRNNPVSKVSDSRQNLEAQREKENRAASRWMPNLENIVRGGKTILGVATADPEHGYPMFRISGSQSYTVNPDGGGSKYVLCVMTVYDGWDREFFYYSAPPYQSYRLWSAGPDGNTFPPWISLDSLPNKEREQAAGWVADDIVRFDR